MWLQRCIKNKYLGSMVCDNESLIAFLRQLWIVWQPEVNNNNMQCTRITNLKEIHPNGSELEHFIPGSSVDAGWVLCLAQALLALVIISTLAQGWYIIIHKCMAKLVKSFLGNHCSCTHWKRWLLPSIYTMRMWRCFLQSTTHISVVFNLSFKRKHLNINNERTWSLCFAIVSIGFGGN